MNQREHTYGINRTHVPNGGGLCLNIHRLEDVFRMGHVKKIRTSR